MACVEQFKAGLPKVELCSFTSSTMPRFDYTAAIEELQTLRTTNERRSEHVAALGARLIREKHMAKLNDQGTTPFPINATLPNLTLVF